MTRLGCGDPVGWTPGGRLTPVDASEWDRRYASVDLLWSAEPNRWVAAELAELPPGRALDLAAGEGRNAIWLAGRGWHVTAVDFSAVAVDKGRAAAEAAQVTVDWLVADLLDYRPARASVDLVLVAYLHLPPAQLRTVLRRGVRALAPGGVLLVIGHDVRNLVDGTGGPQDPTLLYDPDVLAADLVAADERWPGPGGPLRVERAERVRRPVPGAPRDAVDTLVRARRAAS